MRTWPFEASRAYALPPHDEIWTEFILHVDCCAVTRNRLLERYDRTCALRPALAFVGNSSMRMPMITAHRFQ